MAAALHVCRPQVNKLRETREQLRVKDLIIIDLKKKRREVAQRLRDFQQLYDLVKNQRNKFVNLIQVRPPPASRCNAQPTGAQCAPFRIREQNAQ